MRGFELSRRSRESSEWTAGCARSRGARPRKARLPGSRAPPAVESQCIDRWTCVGNPREDADVLPTGAPNRPAGCLDIDHEFFHDSDLLGLDSRHRPIDLSLERSQSIQFTCRRRRIFSIDLAVWNYGDDREMDRTRLWMVSDVLCRLTVMKCRCVRRLSLEQSSHVPPGIERMTRCRGNRQDRVLQPVPAGAD